MSRAGDQLPVVLAVFFGTFGIGLFTGYPGPFAFGFLWAAVVWFVWRWMEAQRP